MNNSVNTLNSVKMGEVAVISELSCKGTKRRRFQDLGIIKGAKIQPVFRSICSDPVAYSVKGTVIALRCEDADTIFVN